MEKVRLGVLGAGNIAVMNLKGYLLDPRCDVVAVCDTDEVVGRQAAQDWGAPSFYSDLDAMLNDSSLDAIEVLTPNSPPSRSRHCGAGGGKARLGAKAGGQHH